MTGSLIPGQRWGLGCGPHWHAREREGATMSAPLHRITTLWAGHSVVTVQDEDALVTRAVCYLDRDPLEGRWHIVTLDRVSHAHPYDESGVGYSTRREAAMAYLGGLWVR